MNTPSKPLPEIPARYASAIEEARQCGYLVYTECYGSGRLNTIWQQVCIAECRLRIAIRSEPRAVWSLVIVNAQAIGGFPRTLRATVNSLLAEHCQRVLWPTETQAVASIPSNIVPFIARRLVALGSAVAK